jgi:hypothetical protein
MTQNTSGEKGLSKHEKAGMTRKVNKIKQKHAICERYRSDMAPRTINGKMWRRDHHEVIKELAMISGIREDLVVQIITQEPPTGYLRKEVNKQLNLFDQ